MRSASRSSSAGPPTSPHSPPRRRSPSASPPSSSTPSSASSAARSSSPADFSRAAGPGRRDPGRVSWLAAPADASFRSSRPPHALDDHPLRDPRTDRPRDPRAARDLSVDRDRPVPPDQSMLRVPREPFHFPGGLHGRDGMGVAGGYKRVGAMRAAGLEAEQRVPPDAVRQASDAAP